jgi:hypothetical protein
VPIGSAMHTMQMLASSEPPKFRSEGRRCLRPRSRNGARPLRPQLYWRELARTSSAQHTSPAQHEHAVILTENPPNASRRLRAPGFGVPAGRPGSAERVTRFRVEVRRHRHRTSLPALRHLCGRAQLYPAPQHIDLGAGCRGGAMGSFRPHRTGAMQYPANGLRRIYLPRRWVNKGKKRKDRNHDVPLQY